MYVLYCKGTKETSPVCGRIFCTPLKSIYSISIEACILGVQKCSNFLMFINACIWRGTKQFCGLKLSFRTLLKVMQKKEKTEIVHSLRVRTFLPLQKQSIYSMSMYACILGVRKRVQNVDVHKCMHLPGYKIFLSPWNYLFLHLVKL